MYANNDMNCPRIYHKLSKYIIKNPHTNDTSKAIALIIIPFFIINVLKFFMLFISIISPNIVKSINSI